MRCSVSAAMSGTWPSVRAKDVSAAQRDGVSAASSGGSDFFEELIVNPALLTLARQRGDLDCGGLRHLVVAYGNFTQIVMPLPGTTGHISVCVERDADAALVADQIANLLRAAST
jgi:hypothetical protein